MALGNYSLGIGDRFGHQGEAQLKAIIKAKQRGIHITPVWNKSFREHQIINSHPEDTRKEADLAVNEVGWQHDYFVDADHINLKNVDYFLSSSDFYTLDVADYIGKKASKNRIDGFVRKQNQFIGTFNLPGINQPFYISEEMIRGFATNYLNAIDEASKIYQHICTNKAEKNVVVEISMDETKKSQTPLDMLFILAAIADVGIPVHTIAPKFTGEFYKGIDYIGNLHKFEHEFEQDMLVIQFCMNEFNLRQDLKLSVHSGSDKFSIYPIINRLITKYNSGVHIKTAGTTWLEELIGLAIAEGDGLGLVKKIYREAFYRIEELCRPYSTVIYIDRSELPEVNDVENWGGQKFVATLQHDSTNSHYNRHFRQLMHIGYKIAAELGDGYYQALAEYKTIIGQHVTENLFERHIKRLFF